MNIIQVSDTVFRGPRPESAADWIQLGKLGITTILSLECGWFEFLHGEMNQEFDDAVDAQIQPIHIQLGDFFPPSAQSLDRIYNLITYPSSGKVYVHCLHGVDRTGLVIAAYRVRAQKWKVDGAIAEMEALGFHRWFYFWWLPSFRQYLKALGGL